MYQTTIEAMFLNEAEKEVDEACCSNGEDKQQIGDTEHDVDLPSLHSGVAEDVLGDDRGNACLSSRNGQYNDTLNEMSLEKRRRVRLQSAVASEGSAGRYSG